MTLFVKDPVSALYFPSDLNLRQMDKEEFTAANFSTDLDLKAYIPGVGLAVAVAQVAYGTFGLLRSVLLLNRDGCLEGLRNIVRGGIQAIPIIGFWSMAGYDHRF